MWPGANGAGFIYEAARVYESTWIYEPWVAARNWLPEEAMANVEFQESGFVRAVAGRRRAYYSGTTRSANRTAHCRSAR